LENAPAHKATTGRTPEGPAKARNEPVMTDNVFIATLRLHFGPDSFFEGTT
jgi:hypothetical protein